MNFGRFFMQYSHECMTEDLLSTTPSGNYTLYIGIYLVAKTYLVTLVPKTKANAQN